MNLRKIFRILLHPTTIKIVAMIGIVGFFFILPTYAETTTDSAMTDFQDILQKFLSLCSRGWIVLSILAGKLMTNDFVYGSFIHLDIYLWKIRNIIKNFANFALVGLVLSAIVKGLIGKEALDVKKVITNTLVAGILIQASWFLMGALVDISTIATAGISSFPMSFLKNDQNLQTEINKALEKIKSQRVIIDLEATGANTVKTQDITPLPGNTDRKNILPSQSSVSGPFIYLGMGVFRFQNYLTTETTTGTIDITLGFALRFFFMFIFTVGLLLLLIANIMRIGLLWIFIVGSPFLILAQVFKLKVGEGSGGLGKIFSLPSLIAVVFKPVIFVAGISMMLIVIVSMQNSISGSGATRENNLNGVTLGRSGDSTSTMNIEGISNISVDQKDIFGKDVIDKDFQGQTQNIFSHIIMLLLTLFLMRRFIKISLTTGGGPIEDVMKKLVKNAEDLAKSAPILPFKGGASLNAIKSFSRQQRDTMLQKGFGMNKEGTFTEAEDNFQNYVNTQLLGLPPSWSNQDYATLEQMSNTGDAGFMTKSIELGKKNLEGLKLSDGKWKTSLDNWFKKIQGSTTRKDLKNKYQFTQEYTDFNTFFGAKNDDSTQAKTNRKFLHDYIGGDNAVSSSGKKRGNGDITYNELMNNEYYIKTENPAK